MQTLIRCRKLRTNAPSDTMPHDYVAGMRPGALRPLGSARSRFKRTVGVQHGVRKRCRLRATFRPPTRTVSVAMRTFKLTTGARRNGTGRRARDAGRSCTWLPTLEPTLVAWTAVLYFALSLRRVAAREDSDTAAIGLWRLAAAGRGRARGGGRIPG
jgi:hypothetical protein